jgi:hypothetical protein
VNENVEYLQELQELCGTLNRSSNNNNHHNILEYQYLATNQSLSNNHNSSSDNSHHINIVFRTSISSTERTALFLTATGNIIV